MTNSHNGMVFGDISLELKPNFIAIITIRRAPNNFFDTALIKAIADALAWCETSSDVRAIILTGEGKHFCAGAAFSKDDGSAKEDPSQLYVEAVRLFETSKPIIAAINGAAIGGGLGLAMTADFRICASNSRFAANFAKLGFHHGFGLSVTLPLVIGHQKTLELLYRGERIDASTALAIGLCDDISEPENLISKAIAMATDITSSAPLAIQAIRKTMRGHLAEEIRAATAHEYSEQIPLQQTEDFVEGVRAYAEKRKANFKAR